MHSVKVQFENKKKFAVFIFCSIKLLVICSAAEQLSGFCLRSSVCCFTAEKHSSCCSSQKCTFYRNFRKTSCCHPTKNDLGMCGNAFNDRTALSANDSAHEPFSRNDFSIWSEQIYLLDTFDSLN